MPVPNRYRWEAERVLTGAGVVPVERVSNGVLRAGAWGIRAGGRSTGKNFGTTLEAIHEVMERTNRRTGALIRFSDPEPENGLFIARLVDVADLIARSQR